MSTRSNALSWTTCWVYVAVFLEVVAVRGGNGDSTKQRPLNNFGRIEPYLSGNGYEDIIVAIGTDVEENDDLVENVKVGVCMAVHIT